MLFKGLPSLLEIERCDFDLVTSKVSTEDP